MIFQGLPNILNSGFHTKHRHKAVALRWLYHLLFSPSQNVKIEKKSNFSEQRWKPDLFRSAQKGGSMSKLVYAKEKGCSMQGTEDPEVENLNVLAKK